MFLLDDAACVVGKKQGEKAGQKGCGKEVSEERLKDRGLRFFPIRDILVSFAALVRAFVAVRQHDVEI